MALNIDELVTKIEDYLVSSTDGLFNANDRELIIDALILYKEMN